MKSVSKISLNVLDDYEAPSIKFVDGMLEDELNTYDKKIIVLDDDPTGIQTVHDVSVFTDWSKRSIKEGFLENNSMFFILTNSRGFTASQTKEEHKKIGGRIAEVSKELGKDFVVISRSDSTLRGHYPIETETLKNVLEEKLKKRYDGEIIFPFFKEGGRYTINNIHYVKDGDALIPAADTEFAKDKSFGYKASDMTLWCQEKTGGRFGAKNIVCISLEDLRNLQIDKITEKLMAVKDFNKIIVNAIDYIDVKVFIIAFLRAVKAGKEFIFRSAAAVTKVLGAIKDKPLLTRKELIRSDNPNGGIIIVGSHVNKTTMQLQELENCKYPIEFIEFNAHLVKKDRGLEREVERVVKLVETCIKSGKTVAVYTSRQLVQLATTDKDEILEASVKISDALTSVIGLLTVKPAFIIAKGGITSSDVGTKALRVKRARVMGQIKHGVPVWMTGPESKFSGMPYMIFPGNVGDVTTLKEVVEVLIV